MKGSPLTCTLMPGAWLATSSRAVEDGRKTGRGSCGSGAPRGVSTQIRQALIRPASAASMEIECLSVIAIASPAGSLPGCRARPIRSGERRRSGSPESRQFKANPLLFASAPGPLTYIEFYPCRFMLAASVIKRRVSDRQAQASLNCEQIE